MKETLKISLYDTLFSKTYANPYAPLGLGFARRKDNTVHQLNVSTECAEMLYHVIYSLKRNTTAL